MAIKTPWFIVAALLAGSPVFGQSAPFLPEGVASTMVAAGDIRMQVWRAGDDGLPIVWVQDMHNYFSPQGEENYSRNFLAATGGQRAFLARLGENHRAYAPLRRGYGSTDDDGRYDIPTHGRDLLALLDAEELDRAVFLGRTPAQLDLLWLAEHHPERMAGLILLEGTPQPLPDLDDPDLFALASGFWRSALDISAEIETIDAITAGRLTSYLPVFLEDPDVEIDVPLLYLEGPPMNEGTWMWSTLFQMFKAQATCPEVTDAFPCSVFGDAERVARLDRLLSDHPLNRFAAEARPLMEQRFTDFRAVPFALPGPDGPDNPDASMYGYFYRSIEPFLQELDRPSE